LIRGSEIYLAFIIAKQFCKEAVKEVSIILAERADKYFCGEIALELLKKANVSPI
jgi:hypothetical protein